MSAVEEYRDGVHTDDWSDVVCKRLADAAIAELEAENKQQRKQFTAERCAELMTALEQAEAELEEFRSRHTGGGCGIGVMTGGYCGKKP